MKKGLKFLAASIFFTIGVLGIIFAAILLIDPTAVPDSNSRIIGRTATLLFNLGVPLHWTYIAVSAFIGALCIVMSVILAIEFFKTAADNQSQPKRPEN